MQIESKNKIHVSTNTKLSSDFKDVSRVKDLRKMHKNPYYRNGFLELIRLFDYYGRPVDMNVDNR